MDMVKKLWPTPFKIAEKNVVSFIVQLVVFVVICAVVGWLVSVLAGIPILGIIFSLVGALLEIYGLIGIVLCVLKFIGIV